MIQQKSPWLELVVLGKDCRCSVPRKILAGVKAVPNYGAYLPPQLRSIVPICDGEEAARNQARVAKGEQEGYYNRQTQMYWNWRQSMDEADKFIRPPIELRLGEVKPINKKTSRPWRSNEVNRQAEREQRAKAEALSAEVRAKEAEAAREWLKNLGAN